MADPTFQLLAADGTLLFDFNDPTGATNRRHLATEISGAFSVGQIEQELEIAPKKGLAGSTIKSRRHPHTTGTWAQLVTAASYDDLVTGVGEMLRLLDDPPEGSTLLWQPSVAIERRYLVPLTASPLPALLRGQDLALGQIIKQLADRPGLPMAVLLQPYSFGDRVQPSINQIRNSTMLGVSPTNAGRPDLWSWNTTTNITAEAIVAVDEAYKFSIATNAVRGIRQEARAGSAAPGDVLTGSIYARLAPGSPNASARIRVALDYMDSGGAVLSGEQGTYVTLTSTWTRYVFTGTAAPASTNHVRLTIQFQNNDSLQNDVELRYAQLEKAAAVSRYRTGIEVVSADVKDGLGKCVPVYVEGDQPTPARVTVQPVASDSAMQAVLIAKIGNDGWVGGRKLTDFINYSSFIQCEGGTMGSDTSAGSSTAASPESGNTHAVCTFSTVTGMAKRVRLQKTDHLDALRGTFDVYCRMKAEAGLKANVQLRWGPSLASPPAFSEGAVTIDASESLTGQYAMRKLGRITIPSDTDDVLAGLAFELWAKAVTGSASLRFDFLWFVPVDDNAIGRVFVEGYKENWKGNELVTPSSPGASTGGTVSGGNLKLDSTNETGGTPPNTGLALDTGHHRVTWKYKTQGNPAYIERIRDITANSSPFDIESQWLGNKTIEESIDFDSVAGHSYQFQIVFTGDNGDPDSEIVVISVVHEFVPFVKQNQNVITDADRHAVDLYDSSTPPALLQPISVQGHVPVMLSPGLNLLLIDTVDTPVDAALTDGQSVITRTPNVSVAYSPRWITRG